MLGEAISRAMERIFSHFAQRAAGPADTRRGTILDRGEERRITHTWDELPRHHVDRFRERGGMTMETDR